VPDEQIAERDFNDDAVWERSVDDVAVNHT
jgi:hypothetical protein